MNDERIKIELSSSEALVFFEFLSRFSNDGKLEIVDTAEARVLWSICSLLESSLIEPLDQDYRALLAKAQAALRDKHN